MGFGRHLEKCHEVKAALSKAETIRVLLRDEWTKRVAEMCVSPPQKMWKDASTRIVLGVYPASEEISPAGYRREQASKSILGRDCAARCGYTSSLTGSDLYGRGSQTFGIERGAR